MRKLPSLIAICGALAAALSLVNPAWADEAKKETAPAQAQAATAPEAPEFIVFDKAKLGTVRFPHEEHSKKVGGCATCHEGDKPLFEKKHTEFKMAGMKGGKLCNACHDGKEHYGVKSVFSTTSACMRCHKKQAK